ncbi:MAG: hypothetical protein RPS47_13580 [Colwellia sp.]|jgi:hypothetical protein
MNIIKYFQEVRRDGKIIEENMSVQDLIDEGWGVEQVTTLRWEVEGKKKELHNSAGILAEVLSDRSAVVGIFTQGGNDILKVINPDGTERLTISNNQLLNGDIVKGVFEWFEPASCNSGPCFGVIFKSDSTGNIYQLDIDAISGQVISERRNM